MFVLDAFINSVLQVLLLLLDIYTWIIVIVALLSWVNPDPNNSIVQILYKLAYPAYFLVRKIPTRIGPVDLAPLLILLVLQFLKFFIAKLLYA